MADAMLQKSSSTSKMSESEDSGTKKSTKKASSKQSDKRDSSRKTQRSADKASSPPTSTSKAKGHASVTEHVVEAEIHSEQDTGPDGKKRDDNVSLADVMSVLQVMRNDQDKTNKRIDTLSSKVDDLYNADEYEYDDENYDENELLYGHANDKNKSNVDDIVTQNDDNNNTEPPRKRQRTDVDQSHDSATTCGTEKAPDNAAESQSNVEAKTKGFKDLVEKFKVKDKVDPPVDTDLAELVNNFFQNGLPDHQLAEITKNITRPENCTMLTKTRVNQLIWDLLSDYTRQEENRIQYRQGLMIKAAILITKLVNKLEECKKKESTDFPVQELMDLATDSLGLLGHCNRATNLSRRDLHKPDLSYDYYHLCSSSVPFTEYLYGDDISKKVSDIDSVNKVGRKVSRGRGFGFGYYRRRFGRRGARRGARGRGAGRGHPKEVREANPNSYAVPSRYDSSKNLRRGYGGRGRY